MKNKISIIILIFEENIDVIYKCLEQLKKFNIIIIDNLGNVERKNKIIKKFDIIKYFFNNKNLGFSKSINKGIKFCNTEYLLILNPDCIITESSIKILLEKLNRYEDSFLITPTFYTQNNEKTLNATMLPESGIYKSTLLIDGDICCQSILAAAMFCRTEEIKKIGMFDENFFLFYEDDDLCRRVNKINRSIIQTSDAKAIHQHGEGKSIKNSFKRTFIINYNMTYSELYYFYKINKHHEKLKNLRKKIPKYIFKFILNLVILRLNKSIYFFSKVFAFIRFYFFSKNNKNLI
jgi:N-acetylglucosaminyl-diphospho-decaprenol L-rhamnosyltransferase